MDFLVYDTVQNAAESGLDYLEAEAGLNYLLGGGEELAPFQAPVVWDGLDHVRLTGREGPAARPSTNTRRFPNAARRTLSSSI